MLIKIMDFVECLNSELFNLPKKIGRQPFDDFLKTHFEEFKSLILSISEPHIKNEIKNNIAKIDAVCSELLLALNANKQGSDIKAYRHFEEVMNILKPFLLSYPTDRFLKNDDTYPPLFRARVGDNFPFSREQMFHLPFSLKELASTQRFSRLGFPCLYLSNSIYTCWEELRRPSIHSLQVSHFQVANPNLKILDIALTRNRLRIQLLSFASSRLDLNSVYHTLSVSFLLMWPLIFACSISVTSYSALYKQEYFYPQCLLTWIIEENEFDGVRFFSTHCKPINHNDFADFTNFVFPVKGSKKSDYCDFLTDSFKLTEPISHSLLEIIDLKSTYEWKEWVMQNKKNVIARGNHIIQLAKGLPISYDRTAFGKMEFLLQCFDADFISENS